jgi:hypothetical protein
MRLAHLKRVPRLFGFNFAATRCQDEFVLAAITQICVTGRSATTRLGSVHRVAWGLRKQPHSQRVKAAALSERPNRPIRSSRRPQHHQRDSCFNRAKMPGTRSRVKLDSDSALI